MSLNQDNSSKFSPNQDSEVILSKAIIDKKRKRKHMNAYYSFLTVVLLFCLVQMTCSAVLNISKVISYQRKIQVMEATKNQVEKKRNQLKTEIDNFSSSSSWEALARNNLKMAGNNEILVIIDEKPQVVDNEVENNGKKNGK